MRLSFSVESGGQTVTKFHCAWWPNNELLVGHTATEKGIWFTACSDGHDKEEDDSVVNVLLDRISLERLRVLINTWLEQHHG
jgi:hypothetical protein